jgi:hypothetical protein
MLLMDDSLSFFIFHAASVADTAKSIISKVKINADTSFSVVWETTLANFYYNPQKADTKGAFAEVFSKGNPQFGYRWFDMAENKLVFISQLRMACIDTKTGKISWENDM